MSLRDDILAVKFNKVSGPVKVSAWGRDVHVRTLSVGEVRQCLAATDPDICSVVLGVCDPDGNHSTST